MPDTADQVDRKVAAEAYAKLTRGQELSRKERSALKRFEEQREEELRWKYYRSIPKKHWQQMSGRQVKVINEQAQRYGLPLGEAATSLSNVVRAWHDFLAENAQRLTKTGDPLLDSPHFSPALERYRDEKAKLARMDRLEREGEIISAKEVLEYFDSVGCILRDAGLRIGRECGKTALDVFYEAIAEAERRTYEKYGYPEGKSVDPQSA